MISYTDDLDGITAELLGGFFVDWPNPPTPDSHLRQLRESGAVEIAKDETTGQVVGFITAITDGVLSAYIPLLEVLPAYKGRGIGSELVRRLLSRLDHLYMVDLLCDADLQPRYEQQGMRPAVGTMLRRYSRQFGATPPQE